jgi:hypothetical protein
MSDIGMNSDVIIGTLPISEWRFSVRHICLRYQNNRCRCRMSDIADIEIDVDAHLWVSVSSGNCSLARSISFDGWARALAALGDIQYLLFARLPIPMTPCNECSIVLHIPSSHLLTNLSGNGQQRLRHFQRVAKLTCQGSSFLEYVVKYTVYTYYNVKSRSNWQFKNY